MPNAPTEEQRRTWMNQWRAAAVALARVRQDELREADLALVAERLEDACLQAVRSAPPGPTSGLVAQQRWLHRLPPA